MGTVIESFVGREAVGDWPLERSPLLAVFLHLKDGELVNLEQYELPDLDARISQFDAGDPERDAYVIVRRKLSEGA